MLSAAILDVFPDIKVQNITFRRTTQPNPTLGSSKPQIVVEVSRDVEFGGTEWNILVDYLSIFTLSHRIYPTNIHELQSHETLI